MNRPQKSDEVHQFFEQAPQYVSNLSADLIIGLELLVSLASDG